MGLFSHRSTSTYGYSAKHAPRIQSHLKKENKAGQHSSDNASDSNQTPIEGTTEGDDDSVEEDPSAHGSDDSKSRIIRAADTKVVRKVKKERDPNVPESETEINTRLNSYLWETSSESIDLYKQENNNSDLIGRLYYDDYDSSDPGSGAATPILAHQNSSKGADYFTKFTGGHHSSSLSSISNQLTLNQRLQNHIGTPPSSCSSRGRSIDPGESSRSPSNSRVRPQFERLKSFENTVSFDTTLNDHRCGITLKVRHPHFKFRRNNKTYLAGYNGDKESLKAIEWLFDEMIINGDSVVVLQVLDEKKHGPINKKLAEDSLRQIELLNVHVKKISLILDVVVGKPRKLLQNAIEEYSPNMMAIGTHNYEDKDGVVHYGSHGKSFLQNKSMSKHFLECALVPVVVVKPYHRFVDLPKPIDSEDYFQNWISNFEVPEWTYSKDKHAKKRSVLSPTPSRNGSETNLRGRMLGSESKSSLDDSRSRSRSRSRPFSSLFKHS